MEQDKKRTAITDTPNFLRVAKELSTFKRPYEVTGTLLLFIENSMKDSTHPK